MVLCRRNIPLQVNYTCIKDSLISIYFLAKKGKLYQVQQRLIEGEILTSSNIVKASAASTIVPSFSHINWLDSILHSYSPVGSSKFEVQAGSDTSRSTTPNPKVAKH